MTRLEHLLTNAGEECAEIDQRLSKAKRFGLDEVQPSETENPEGLSNRERIRREYVDLVAVLDMIDPGLTHVTTRELAAKRQKVEKYLDFAHRHCGTLTADERELLPYARLLQLLDEHGIDETDLLKHRLDDWERHERERRESFKG